jgi:hypothetical protein
MPNKTATLNKHSIKVHRYFTKLVLKSIVDNYVDYKQKHLSPLIGSEAQNGNKPY